MLKKKFPKKKTIPQVENSVNPPVNDDWQKFFITAKGHNWEGLVPLDKDSGFTKLNVETLSRYFTGATGLHRPNMKSFEERKPLDTENGFILPPEEGWKGQPYYVVSRRADPKNGSYYCLCLSGGGFRATLFHIGALRRLNELGILKAMNIITSVSGGSITNAILALAWPQLQKHQFSPECFDKYVRDPIYALCNHNIAKDVIVWDLITNPKNLFKEIFDKDTTNSNFMADDLSKIIPEFNKPLSEVLPQQTQGSLEDFSGVPDFIICSTDLRTGEGFYFSKYHVGHLTPNVKSRFSALPHVYKGDATGAKLASKVTLATAIASSASYPAAFQPMVIEVEPAQGGPSFDICVSDGGVHDNVGLDPAINYALPHPYGKCGVLFVSDAGAPLKPRTFPKIQLAFPIPLISSIHIIYAQINVLRFKQQEALIQNMNTCGCWWKVDDLADPNAHKKFPEWFQSYIDEDVVLKLMNFRTDLNKFTENEKKDP